jgi:hypothetical protein
MSLWYDMIDWLGGWPFEVASVARVLDWAATRALVPIKVVDVGTRLGCNEFVFSRGS